MANSSDWIGLAAPSAAPAPAWMALLEDAEPFREGAPFARPEPLPVQPPAPVADAHEDALARAYAEGEAAGRAAAMADAEAAAAQQRALRLAFRKLDEAARDVLASDLAATVETLCAGVLADHAADTTALLARCRMAAARIGGAVDALTLHLHPDDYAALGSDALAGWQVVPDLALERGSLRIEGPDGAASDGPAEWRRAIAAALRA